MDYYGVAIKSLLVDMMGPRGAQEWLRTPSDDFDGLTPQEAIGRGFDEQVLKKVDCMYKNKERENFGTGDP